MSRIGSAFVVAVLVALRCAGQRAEAQAATPVGTEFQVNSYTSGRQDAVAISLAPGGELVIIWESRHDGSQYGVFGQRFGSTGSPLATEFQVNTYTTNHQRYPAVASSDAGAFVVSWSSLEQDGSNYGVFARRFDSTGAGLGVEFLVNAYITGSQNTVALAADADGDFVVVWQGPGTGDSFGVFARRFDSAGTPLAPEFKVNTDTVGVQLRPSVGIDADGDFVVAWGSADASDKGVFAQRFASSGAALGLAFQVNVYTTYYQGIPSVALDSDGDFVVAWQSLRNPGGDGIFARRFDSSGTPTGVEFQANTYDPGSQSWPRAASDSDGDFVIVWLDYQYGGAREAFGRRFKNDGTASIVEFRVNTYITGYQFLPRVAADSDGDFVVAWYSGGQDGSDYGVFAQRFDVPMLIDVDGNSAFTALTDGLLVVRFGFGFTGATLTTGAVAGDCTRCDAASIVPYLESLR